jgi:hypothetical protein
MNIFFRFLVGLFLAATVLASVVPVHEGYDLLTRDVPLNTTDRESSMLLILLNIPWLTLTM